MQPDFTPIAVPVPPQLFESACRAAWLAFYEDVFGWTEHPQLAMEGERSFLRAPTNRQYVTIRASDTPMRTSGYEHLGGAVATPEDVRQLHARAHTHAARDARVELGEMQVGYGGRLPSFRVRDLLPVTIEVQCIVEASRPGEGAEGGLALWWPSHHCKRATTMIAWNEGQGLPCHIGGGCAGARDRPLQQTPT